MNTVICFDFVLFNAVFKSTLLRSTERPSLRINKMHLGVNDILFKLSTGKLAVKYLAQFTLSFISTVNRRLT